MTDARAVPVQQRSRDRFERILNCAMELMAEKGSDALRMSDIVERTGVPFGSLYQYFPDKTAIIATLAERYNAIGRECVQKELSALQTPGDIHAVLCAITDSYYRFFLDEPTVRHVWQATQGDRALQRIDEADGLYLTGRLVEALQGVLRDAAEQAVADFAQVVMVTIAAVVRHAVTLPPDDADRVLETFKRMLPYAV